MNIIRAERVLQTGQTIQIVQGDITTEPVDAIVNAANENLQHGGGVARAILRQAGDIIQKESDDWIRLHGLVTHSHPARTSGGALPAKYVIHAVGPVWGEGDEDAKLTEAVTGALRVADELKAQSLAMPAISTGIFGFPRERATRILLPAIERYCKQNVHSCVRIIKLVLFDEPTVQAFIAAWGPDDQEKATQS